MRIAGDGDEGTRPKAFKFTRMDLVIFLTIIFAPTIPLIQF